MASPRLCSGSWPVREGRQGRRAGMQIIKQQALGHCFCSGKVCGPARDNPISQHLANLGGGEGAALKATVESTCFPEVPWWTQTWPKLDVSSPGDDVSSLDSSLLPHCQHHQVPNPHLKSPYSQQPRPLLTIPCSRLPCHGCHRCCTGPQQLWATRVKISQLSKPQCGFLPPHPP